MRSRTAVQELGFVEDVLATGEEHPLTGQIVTVLVRVREPIEPRAARREIRKHCRRRLEAFKVPVKVTLTDRPFGTARHKKLRR